MTDRITIGEKSGLETPVYVDGVWIGLIVLNPSGYQFMPVSNRAYLNPEDLVCIAELLKK